MTRHNLPPQPTPFTGRAEEIAEISARLDDPTCRLLTLVGPGGIGKTRLAIEVAARNADAFADGVFFVDLQPVSAVDFLVATVADAIDLALIGPDEPQDQLLRYLGDKQMLLVVDNFERLLAGAEILSAILDTTPAVKLLVTSREIVNIQAEWLHPVYGLHYPSAESDSDDETYDAIQLFATRARQVRRDFSLTDDFHCVARICQLVEGMPLALELAANWLKTLPCAQVADEIECSLDFLSTNLRDVPERHRSMWAVFEPTWNRLADAERDSFMRLSVFQGSFDREAAEQVAGASLATLSLLVDKSLLHLTASGRYRMQELVRQYGEDRLNDVSRRLEAMRNRHCAYFLGLLHQQEPHLKGSGVVEALTHIADEIDNVRAAWDWAIAQRRIEDLDEALFSLAYFYYTRNRNHEGLNTLRALRTILPDGNSVLLGRILMWEAALFANLDHLNQASELGFRGLTMLRDSDGFGLVAPPLEVLNRCGLESTAFLLAIKEYTEKNLVWFEQMGDTFGSAYTFLTLRNIAQKEGEIDLWKRYALESLEFARTINHPWCICQALWPAYAIARQEGRYDDARRHLDEVAKHGEDLGDPGASGAAAFFHGEIAYKLGELREAQLWFEKHITLNDQFNPSSYLPIRALSRLATIADQTENRLASHQLIQRAAQRLVEGDYPAGTVATLLGWMAITISQWDFKEWAVELVSTATANPHLGSGPAAPNLLAELENELPPDVFAAALARGQSGDPHAVAAALLNRLTAVESLNETTASKSGRPAHGAGQPLVDPLTERELEVLALIVEGYRNREIADRLHVGVSTVKKHINHIFGKLGVDSRARAIARVRELDLL